MRLNATGVRRFFKKQFASHHYFKESKTIQRKGLIFGILIFGLFGFLDRQLLPLNYLQLYAIRYGVVIPILVLCLAFTYLELFKKHLQVISFTAILSVCLGLIIELSIGKEANFFQLSYFSGLVMFICFSPMVLGLNAFFTFLTTVITFLAFNLVADITVCDGHDLYRCNVFLSENAILLTAGTLGGVLQFNITRLLKSNKLNILRLERQKLRLQKSKQELIHADNIKNKLLFIISHDLKGPLASIKGILNLYSADCITQAEFREHALKLNSLLQGTGSLLDNLLHWSISQYESRGLKKVACNIHHLIDENFKLFEYQASKKKIELINLVHPQLHLTIDYALIDIVFRNIISNAVKFTDSGHLVIKSIQYEKTVNLTFTDTGVGMDSVECQKLFKWEKLSSSSGIHGERGTGLGLLLCKEFVRRHKGNLSIKSKKWQGTTVSISLPPT